MDSEEAFATLHRAVPPDSGYRMRLLCAHGTCKRLESQILASLQRLWEHEVIHEETFPLLAAPRGSFPWQWEREALSPPTWDPNGTRAVLCKSGLAKAAQSPSRVLLGKQAAETLWVRASSQKNAHPKEHFSEAIQGPFAVCLFSVCRRTLRLLV